MEFQPIVPRRRTRHYCSRLMLFIALLFLANGLFGERGLLETIKARRSYAAAAQQLARLRHENDELREQARRLRSDPAAIEAVARGELGLMKTGEILITVRDAR